MSLKRLALAIAMAATVSVCLMPMMSQAGAASVDRAAQVASCSHQLDTAAAPPIPGPKCIPCSTSKPCVNPLTVCRYSGNSTHGCCLGYAGRN